MSDGLKEGDIADVWHEGTKRFYQATIMGPAFFPKKFAVTQPAQPVAWWRRREDGETIGIAYGAETPTWGNPSEWSPLYAAPQVADALDKAVKAIYAMTDALRPPPAGSFARGEHEGICAAARTVADMRDKARAAPQPAPAVEGAWVAPPCIGGCGRPSMMPASEYCAECAAESNPTAPVPHSDDAPSTLSAPELSDAECERTAQEVSRKHPNAGDQEYAWECIRAGRATVAEDAAHSNMRRFVMYRRNLDAQGKHDANQKAPDDAVQFEGVVFHDGSVAVRWRTPIHSTSTWACMDDLLKIHGHPEYGSEIVWLDAARGKP